MSKLSILIVTFFTLASVSFAADGPDDFLKKEKTEYISKIEKALEMYRMNEGPYPKKLSDLVAAGFLREKDLELRGNEYIQYVRLDTRYKLKITQVSE